MYVKEITDNRSRTIAVIREKGKYFSDHLSFLYGIKLKNKEPKKLNTGTNKNESNLFDLVLLCITIVSPSNIKGFLIESKWDDKK